MTSNNLNIILIIVAGLAFISLLHYVSRQRKIKMLINNKNNNKNAKKKLVKEAPQYNRLKKDLNTLLLLKGKENYSSSIYGLILLSLVGVFLLLLTMDNPVLAVIIPVEIYVFMGIIVKELIIDFDVTVRANLPILINHMVKGFSKTNDLTVVMYESSKELQDPMRKSFFDLSRKMIANSSEQVLVDFADTLDNTWLHAFIFLLVNYKQNSSKEDIVNNLLELSKMIERRNEITAKMITDRKPVVIMNYLVWGAGILVFMGNLIFNPIAINYFIHSIQGGVVLIAGIVAIFSTIIINIKLSK